MSSLVLVFYTGLYLLAFGGLLGGTVSGCLAALALCLLAAHLCIIWTVAGLPMAVSLPLWLDFPGLVGGWSLVFDHLSALVLALVLLVSVLVHLYSIEYLSSDPGLFRFFSYLLLFTGFMSLMVLAAGFIPFFVGWEGIGLMSYFLIGFWSSRPQAGKSALKAVFLNRPGDFCLVAVMVLAGSQLGSLDFSFLALSVPYALGEPVFPGSSFGGLLGILVLVAAVAKSAQLGFHSWLPDAMEGPTPVSALLHAATMVTAGVYLCLRLSSLVQALAWLQLGLVFIGLATALLGAVGGFAQFDVKRSIAYSTTANLGLMFACCGLAQFHLALFHLVAHAFFKALLFLSAGSAIHGCRGEQDLRRLRGFYSRLPATSSFFVLGCACAAGWPFTSSFYSKELVVGATLSHVSGWSSPPALAIVLSFVVLSCLYALRPFLILASQPGSAGSQAPCESGWRILAPLLGLGALGLASGFYLVPWFSYPLGLGLSGLSQPVAGLGWLAQLELAPGLAATSPLGLLPAGLFFPWAASLLLGGSGYPGWRPVVAMSGFGWLRFWGSQATGRIVSTLGRRLGPGLVHSVERGWLEWLGPLSIATVLRQLGLPSLAWQSGGLVLVFLAAGLSSFCALAYLLLPAHGGPAGRLGPVLLVLVPLITGAV